MRRLLLFLILVVMTMTFMMLQSAEASSITTTVQGTQTVYFAGRTQFELMSFPLSGGWVQSDVLDPDTVPDAIDITGLGSLISISASGLWSHTPDPSGPAATGPEGRGIFELSQAEYEPFGVSLLGADLNMLAGVFLSDTAPDPSATPPQLTLGIDDMTTPVLNQAFAIGAELEGIIVPAGATRLYLGLHDGYEWTNNSGSVDARIAGVPEPATMLLLGTGLIGLAAFGRNRIRT